MKKQEKNKICKGKVSFVGPTYSALSLWSSFHKKALVNQE